MLRIYLVRHAQVAANLKGINFNDKADLPLTQKGRVQGEKLAKRLMKLGIDKIFISETKRSFQTITPLLKLKAIPFGKDPRLNEANFGIFSGLTLKEAEERYPRIYKERLKNKWNYKIPKGESFKDVAERFKSFLKDLQKVAKKERIENTLIMTHATVLKVFLIKYLKFSIEEADSIHFENASISVFDIKEKKIKPIVVNDFHHLLK